MALTSLIVLASTASPPAPSLNKAVKGLNGLFPEPSSSTVLADTTFSGRPPAISPNSWTEDALFVS
tara:strand:+ start:715 stop:912 length:198 start_codon:yes stop_codon:yes gene_type:complete